MDEIWRFKKVDFTKSTDREKQYWYNQTRHKNLTLREIETLANRAVFVSEKMAYKATFDLYEKEYRRVQDPKTKKKHRQKHCFRLEEQRQSNHEDSDGDECVESWLMMDYNSDCCNSRMFVSDYYIDTPPDKEINSRMYRKLREVSEESAVLRMMVAWYMHTTGYVNILTDEQADFWETDLSLIDLMEAANKEYQVQWLLSYTGMDRPTFDKHRAYIQRRLSEFFKEVVYSNA